MSKKCICVETGKDGTFKHSRKSKRIFRHECKDGSQPWHYTVSCVNHLDHYLLSSAFVEIKGEEKCRAITLLKS